VLNPIRDGAPQWPIDQTQRLARLAFPKLALPKPALPKLALPKLALPNRPFPSRTLPAIVRSDTVP
jgi:hypothetical protein